MEVMNETTPVANPTWSQNIKEMFTERDISCMQGFGIHLDNYDSVKAHATAIRDRVKSGSMPKGGKRWSQDMVQTFENWMKNGFPQ